LEKGDASQAIEMLTAQATTLDAVFSSLNGKSDLIAKQANFANQQVPLTFSRPFSARV